jgi:4-diphosphocytidyl-2-C-methyl-D-erythritol kinase
LKGDGNRADTGGGFPRESGALMSVIAELARAKINLTLKVRGRRPDGYHDIESLIVFADFGDEVRLAPGETTRLRVSGPFAAAIAGPNLVETALARLTEAEPRLVLGSVALEKCLPVAAGIGGGSADAAAILRAVRRANPALADAVDWGGIAASLGADVPVCLSDRPAFIWGAGEHIEALADVPRLHAVLVNPLAGVPDGKTARVFARLGAPQVTAREARAREAGDAGPAPQVPSRFKDATALIDYMRTRGNDLAVPAAAVVPEIAHVAAALTAAPHCLLAGLSGAGPTCYGIFATMEQAAAAAASLRQSRPVWWVAASVLGR